MEPALNLIAAGRLCMSLSQTFPEAFGLLTQGQTGDARTATCTSRLRLEVPSALVLDLRHPHSSEALTLRNWADRSHFQTGWVFLRLHA